MTPLPFEFRYMYVTCCCYKMCCCCIAGHTYDERSISCFCCCCRLPPQLQVCTDSLLLQEGNISKIYRQKKSTVLFVALGKACCAYP